MLASCLKASLKHLSLNPTHLRMAWHTQCGLWKLGVRGQQSGKVTLSPYSHHLHQMLESPWVALKAAGRSQCQALQTRMGLLAVMYLCARHASSSGFFLLPWGREPGMVDTTFPVCTDSKHVASAIEIPALAISLGSGTTRCLGYTKHSA